MLGLWYLLQLHISLRFGPLDGQEFVPSQGKKEKVKTSLTDYSPRLHCNERHVDSQAATSNEGPISPINRLTGVTLHWCNSSTIKKEQWQSETEVANDCAIVSPSTMQKIPTADSPGQMAGEPLMLRSILKYEWLPRTAEQNADEDGSNYLRGTWGPTKPIIKRQPDFKDPQYARQDQGQVSYTDLQMSMNEGHWSCVHQYLSSVLSIAAFPPKFPEQSVPGTFFQ